MFVDIKNESDNPVVRKLVSESAWDKSPDAMEKRTAEFRRREDMGLYGWIENDDIVGVCGIVIHSSYIEINNIAVAPNVRKHGIGKAMIAALQQKYETTIKAETDDDSVEFYQRCGFETNAFIKAYDTGEYRRYDCVLHMVQ